MKIKVISKSPVETQKIASFLMEAVLKQHHYYETHLYPTKQKRALVISLEGSLGSGKTEFLKGIAKGLKLKEKIFSPTFLIMKSFSCKSPFFKILWHLDCYRIKSAKEIKELGFLEIIKDPQNLIFIEWGNKIKEILPKNHWKIKFKIIDKNTRILEFHIPKTHNL